METLYRSDIVRVTDVRCRPREHGCGAEECAFTDDIVFPRSGFFVRHVGKETTAADPNAVLFFRRQEPYRISHPVCGGDDCTSFTFAPKLLHDAFDTYCPSAEERNGCPFGAQRALSGAGRFLIQQQFRRVVRATRNSQDGIVDGLTLDEFALTLLDGVARDASVQHGGHKKGQRGDTALAHRDLVENTREWLSKNMRKRVTLPQMAHAVHSSPFHLSRVFQRHTGLPIHRYLTRLRLRESLERLADGSPHLTELALSLGFAGHSHFSDAFRREFGLTPSAFRDRASSSLIRQMSKNLKA